MTAAAGVTYTNHYSIATAGKGIFNHVYQTRLRLFPTSAAHMMNHTPICYYVEGVEVRFDVSISVFLYSSHL